MNGDLSGDTKDVKSVGLAPEENSKSADSGAANLKSTDLKSTVFSKKDSIFAVAMLVCGFLYWNLMVSQGPGAGVTLFAIILCGIVGIYLHGNGVKQTKGSIACLLIIGLSAFQFFIFDLTPLSFFNFIFLTVAAVYWICYVTRRRLDQKLSIYFLGDMINQFLLVPFHNFLCCFASLKPAKKDGNFGRNLLSALVGVVIFFPILALVVNLLVSADAAFESLLSNFKFSLSVDAVEYLVEIILGIPVACYIYGIVYGNLKKRHTGYISVASMDKQALGLRFAPKVPVFSGLTVLNGIYLLFFIAQGSYLFSAFASHLPETMTYAEYARRGFFELCGVAAINLMVIGVAYLITKRNEDQVVSKGLKAEILTICGFTVLLIGTALSKMGLYIHYYGLTQLRVYTTWFMALLLFMFVIVALRQFLKFNGSKIVIIGFVLSFLVLTYGNVDGMIAKYNIDRYREGTLLSVDTQALMDLSDGAVPHMVALYHETDNQVLKGQLKFAITKVYGGDVRDLYGDTYEEGFYPEDTTVVVLPMRTDWRCFNLQSYQADQLKETL